LQEALRNAFKHSGVKQFSVRLEGSQSGITLEIRDRGIGFDVGKTRSSPGLGLIGMQERVSLLHGTLVIESGAGHGTDIRVSIPLAENGATAEKRVAAGQG
jgi:signal transduction histidine kinase